ncbi:hypothetical protein P3T76_002409 [Phytophthora citrophthora]|uniref:Uncharacterized protein n=1 Tax=Phytophthora citrophthora TaxID=4793 RepID=A0AAD9GY20_9STRA|nr:hypothetical protein P3T76_002409 [Phytophthora citrophthora]
MPSQVRVSHHTPLERQQVLHAYRVGRDWLAVAISNDFPITTAYDSVNHGRADDLPRGGRRNVKLTTEAKSYLEKYINDDCTCALKDMRKMLQIDCNISVHTSTISRHHINMLYTVKQVRIEPTTCNSDGNKEKRREFATKLLKHQRKGNCIVYYDETNFNVCLKRLNGRARLGQRAIVKLPPSKGANLQVQCAVSSSLGLVTYTLQRGSIRMEKNAAFV